MKYSNFNWKYWLDIVLRNCPRMPSAGLYILQYYLLSNFYRKYDLIFIFIANTNYIFVNSAYVNQVIGIRFMYCSWKTTNGPVPSEECAPTDKFVSLITYTSSGVMFAVYKVAMVNFNHTLYTLCLHILCNIPRYIFL